MDYKKYQYKNKESQSVDTIDRDSVKKLTPKQKEAKRRRGQKTRFINDVASRLQSNTPKSEVWFKGILDVNGLSKEFLSNIPLNDMIPDFICLSSRIVIEVDGSVHENPKQIERDLKKDKEYKKLGYTCFRVIHHNEEQAKCVIKQIQAIITISI